jgi:hypothetical protein
MPYGVVSLMLFAFMLSAPANAQLFSPDACPPGFRWGWDLHCHPAAYHPNHRLVAPHRVVEPRLFPQR